MPSPSPQQELKPDCVFEGKSFWIMRKGEDARQRAALNSMKASQPTWDSPYDEVFPSHAIVFGEKFSSLQGYISMNESESNSDIGKVSLIEYLGESVLTDCQQKIVTRNNLAQYEGFKEYTGTGKICHIGMIRSFLERQGNANSAIRFLQSLNYELIEAEVISSEALSLFEKNGFIDPGINIFDGDQIVMVWHNPKFRRQ